tara:strand:- start:3110 stop:4060 length:951 start_codon:yes stop_codon:yes gene_type:complete
MKKLCHFSFRHSICFSLEKFNTSPVVPPKYRYHEPWLWIAPPRRARSFIDPAKIIYSASTRRTRLIISSEETMKTSKRHLLGMLTPSSNTILEPVTSDMIAQAKNVSAHFGRFRVTEISLGDQALGQFEFEPMLAASDLLADALVSCICWNGTSAGWLGFDKDEALCAAITAHTGIPACSSVLALNEIFARTGVKTFGLVTPYISEIQSRIIKNYADHGYECTAEQHLEQKVNFSFSEVTEADLETMIRDVAKTNPDAIVIFCTNLRGGPIVDKLERELGIPIYDTVQTAVWKSMVVSGANPSDITGWGQLFWKLA